MAFDDELAQCIEQIVGAVPPEFEGGSMLLAGQWLGERNLGLVPVDDAAAFSWPGQWLARVRIGDKQHAVVMFGSPSGPWLDPAGALERGGEIEAGWVVARLDLELPGDSPYGTATSSGSVAGLLLARDAEAPLECTETANAIAGQGLEGDRYADGRGTFGPGRGYELTLVEAEVLDEIALSWEDARRNIVTRGVRLNALVGRRFRVGEVECIGRRLAEPCAHLERLARPGLLRPLVHRGGLRADILTGGRLRAGDEIVVLD
ncbi:MAG TPA: MOSC domain-containing protein [Gaiellaceae bacterium]